MRKVGELKAKAKSHNVIKMTETQWSVVSGASGNEYMVTENGDGTLLCTCPWGDPYCNGRGRHASGRAR